MEMLISNTFGKIWLVGGSVMREIIFHMNDPTYHDQSDPWNIYSAGTFPHRDLDFIAEEISGKFRVSRGWNLESNTFGGIKLKSETITVDLWKLRKHTPCKRHGLEYTIDNVMRLAPFNVQGIAIDLQKSRIIGEPGLSAIKTRTVTVNHHDEAVHYCKVYGTDIATMVRKKAEEYSFTPICL